MYLNFLMSMEFNTSWGFIFVLNSAKVFICNLPSFESIPVLTWCHAVSLFTRFVLHVLDTFTYKKKNIYYETWGTLTVAFPFYLVDSIRGQLNILLTWAKYYFYQIVFYLEKYASTSGQMGAQHMVLNEEQVAFSDWMNNNLGSDKDVNHLLPLNVRNI